MYLDTTSTLNRKIIDFRNLGFTDLQVLGKYSYNKAEQLLDEHCHPDMIEICYCDKGSQYFVVNNKQYLVKGGEVFIHFPGELHGSGSHPENKGLLYWMIISVSSAPGQISALCNFLVSRKTRHFKAEKSIRKNLEEIFDAYCSNDEPKIKNIRISVLTQTFLLNLIDTSGGIQAENNKNRLRNVLGFIDANLMEDISISLLATQMNLSESRFKILFKELMGFTPADYIQRKRVAIAVERLSENPGISLSDLAYELNFSSRRYFSAVIRKYTGKSPASLRRVNKKAGS